MDNRIVECIPHHNAIRNMIKKTEDAVALIKKNCADAYVTGTFSFDVPRCCVVVKVLQRYPGGGALPYWVIIGMCGQNG